MIDSDRDLWGYVHRDVGGPLDHWIEKERKAEKPSDKEIWNVVGRISGVDALVAEHIRTVFDRCLVNLDPVSRLLGVVKMPEFTKAPVVEKMLGAVDWEKNGLYSGWNSLLIAPDMDYQALVVMCPKDNVMRDKVIIEMATTEHLIKVMVCVWENCRGYATDNAASSRGFLCWMFSEAWKRDGSPHASKS